MLEINIAVRHRYVATGGRPAVRTTDHTILFPQFAGEITLKMWSDYHMAKQKDPEWAKKLELLSPDEQSTEMSMWDTDRWGEYYTLVLSYLRCFVAAGDADALKDAPIYDGDGIMTIYFAIAGAIASYQPKIISEFTYKNERYIVDTYAVDQFGRKTYGPNLTANQVFDALQYEHVLNARDENGNYIIEDRRYQIDLAVLALMSVRVKESGELDERPLQFPDRQKWLEQKIKHFGGVTMDVAMDVAFFLTSSKTASLNIRMRELLSKLTKYQLT